MDFAKRHSFLLTRICLMNCFRIQQVLRILVFLKHK